MKDVDVLSDALRDLYVFGPWANRVEVIIRRVLDANATAFLEAKFLR